MTEETLFDMALDLSPEKRAAFLAAACPDESLRRRVEALLAANEPGDSFLEQPAVVENVTHSFPGIDRVGTTIGPYRLLQQIGEGGMGVVFMAEQDHPVRRRVALKIVKPGMDTALVVARFEAERQALALMSHPNIAQVLDVGTTDQGRPFFVMELVNGVSITEFCDQERLTPRERLELFVPVCLAVQHAHQKGIIHRDLKPSNVLVALYDGVPVPKIIDFGVAKAVNQRLTDRTLFTEFGQIIGTLEYMSPEQAERNTLDIDTRSDIYSLGVLLYELLTGTTPIDRSKLSNAAYSEMLRMIREDEPVKPSTRLSHSGDALPSISARRKMEPASLSKFIRGELDWIVMRCLEKDRGARYPSASALASDIQRQLNDEPVEACPPSPRYRLKKLARKHRAALATAAGLIGVILVGAAVSIGQAIRATNARAEADTARAAEARRADGEAAARESAQKRLVQIEKNIAILGSIFSDLDPRNIEQEPLFALLGKRLEKAADQVAAGDIGDPLTVARLQKTLGDSQLGLGEATKAVDTLTRARAGLTQALGPAHPETLRCMESQGEALREVGQVKRAIAVFEESLQLQKQTLGEDHPDALSTLGSLGDAYRIDGQLDRAIDVLERTLSRRRAVLGENHQSTYTSLHNLSLAYLKAGQLEKAHQLMVELYAIVKVHLGPDHPFSLSALNNLAISHKSAGRFDLAVSLLQDQLEVRKARYGLKHLSTLNNAINLAACLYAAGKADEAIPVLEDTRQRLQAAYSIDHPLTLSCTNQLALSLRKIDQNARALTLFEETVTLRRAKCGPNHPDTLTSADNLANSWKLAGELDKAIALIEDTLTRRRNTLGPTHPDTLFSMNSLAMVCIERGEHRRAIAILDEAFPTFQNTFGPEHPHTNSVMANRARAYFAAGQDEKALGLLTEFVDRQRLRLREQPALFADAADAIAGEMLRAKHPEPAEKLLRECLAVREILDAVAWKTADTRSRLGQSMLDQKKFAEAESPLLAAHASLVREADKIPTAKRKSIFADTRSRLVQLYTALGKSDEAAKWQEKKP
ncbi:MAG: tetratricopeptide repeat protein [Gemmataceae bacterium]|nr:tetratricopeptide repeat protein [Gemmataceae bacterium]